MDSNVNKRIKSRIRQHLILESSEEKTFKYDKSLPSLPVPDLDQTLKRYLNSIFPFVSPSQFEQTKILVENFKNGVGKTLHGKLLERASKNKNWLADWWLKYAYLMMRDPIAPTMNMAGPQSLNLTIWRPNEEKALEEAALALWSVMDFYMNLRKEKIRPQLSKKGQRLSMYQFRYLFNTTRIPKEGEDEISNYFKTETEGTCPRHIIVLCYGHIWVMDPWYTQDEILTVPEIEDHMKYIMKLSESLGQGQEISVMTFDERERWAKNRKWLMSLSAENAEKLKTIESAILVYSLDENSPKNISEVCQLGLCGSPQNRWADKSYCAITFKNGYHSTTNDHSPYDAMVSVMVGYYQHEIITEEFGGAWNGPKHIRSTPRPKRIIFTVDNLIRTSIENVKILNLKRRQNIGVKFGEFLLFGKNWIKGQKLHPDAFLQCSLQLAYYRLHKKFGPTYETATTRQYCKARTETIRSCTPEMTEFVLAMVSDTSTRAEKMTKLQSAVSRHVTLKSDCENGQGVDRHLMGLALIAAENGMPTPELFTDPAFALSGGGGNFILSTSTVGYTYVLGGVAAMVKEGYGVFYGILPDRVHFFLTNFVEGETCLEEFFSSVSESLTLMYDVVNEPQSRL